MSIPQFVRVCEMGPRDGLQNEDEIVSTEDKVRYIDLLSETGLTLIEATSFVSPKAIPQLADASEVFTRIHKRPGVRYPVLTPNVRGLERAKEAGANAIAVFTAASEEFTKRNINMTIDESLETFRDVVRNAKENAFWVRGYVSTAFGSPFGDTVVPSMVVDVTLKLFEMGCDEVSIGDTIGVGVPSQVDELVPLLLRETTTEKLRCTSMTLAERRSQTFTRRCSTASPSSIRAAAASAAARTRRAQPATWERRTCSTCSTGWELRPGSISPRYAPLRALLRAC